MSAVNELRALLDIPTLPDASEDDYDALLAVLRRWFVHERVAEVARRRHPRLGTTLLEVIGSHGPRVAADLLESEMVAIRDGLRGTGGTS